MSTRQKMFFSRLCFVAVMVLGLSAAWAAATPHAINQSQSIVGGWSCSCTANSTSSDCTFDGCGTTHSCLGSGSNTCEDEDYCDEGSGCGSGTVEQGTDCV